MQHIRIHSLVAGAAIMVASFASAVIAQPLAPAAVPDGSLPALNLPAVAAPNDSALPLQSPSVDQSTPASQAEGAIATAAVSAVPAAPKTYSFGDSTLSILFLPDQINGMKGALRTFEDSGLDAAAPEVVALPAATAPEAIEDPLVYPVFYLASIVYDDPKDWSLWISGYKITSRKNDTDVTVLSVTPDSATFLWKPSFSKAMARRTSDKLFAPTDAVKSRFTSVQRASFDVGTGATVFTLKPNQTFAVGYFKIFEGYVDGPTLTALPVVAPVTSGSPEEGFDGDGQPLPGEMDLNDGFGQPGLPGPASLNFNGVDSKAN